MQVCTLLEADNHANTPPQFLTGRMPFLPPNRVKALKAICFAYVNPRHCLSIVSVIDMQFVVCLDLQK